jgi:hypothetical protein
MGIVSGKTKRIPICKGEAMSHANQLFGSRRRQFTTVLLIAAAAVFMLLSMQGSAAQAEPDGTCEGGKFCVWTGTFYTGSEENWACSGFTTANFELLSAKNHCSVNVRIGWTENGGPINWKACMSPGGERPEPGRFDTIEPFGC